MEYINGLFRSEKKIQPRKLRLCLETNEPVTLNCTYPHFDTDKETPAAKAFKENYSLQECQILCFKCCFPCSVNEKSVCQDYIYMYIYIKYR